MVCIPFDNLVLDNADVGLAIDCGYVCGGDPTELCGAGNRLSIYKAGAA